MTRKEAYDTMRHYISQVGGCGVEYWKDEDRNTMVTCLNRLNTFRKEDFADSSVEVTWWR